jgi:predicted nucleotidyltransferase
LREASRRQQVHQNEKEAGAPARLAVKGGWLTVNPILKSDEATLAAFCVKHHIQRLSLFGSQLESSAGIKSDIDILVEFDPGEEPGLLGLVEMECELSTVLDGQPVDMRTPKDLSRHFKDEVMRSSQIQYER